MYRRNFITILCILLLATPTFARTHPPITLDAFHTAMENLQAEFPDRFIELGERVEGPIQRRGRAIYMKYENGRVRFMQQDDGSLTLPLDALVLKTDPPEEKDSDDDESQGAAASTENAEDDDTPSDDGNPRNPTGHTPHCHGPC